MMFFKMLVLLMKAVVLFVLVKCEIAQNGGKHEKNVPTAVTPKRTDITFKRTDATPKTRDVVTNSSDASSSSSGGRTRTRAPENDDEFLESLERQFLERLEMSTAPRKRSVRSNEEVGDSVPEFLKEILRKMEAKKRKMVLGIDGRNSFLEDAVVFGIPPHTVQSLNRRTKATFHLDAALKLKTIKLAEIVHRKPRDGNGRRRHQSIGRIVIRLCGDVISGGRCKVISHETTSRVAAHSRRFTVYDVTRALERWRAEVVSRNSTCSDCYAEATYAFPVPVSSDFLLTVSNRELSDLIISGSNTSETGSGGSHRGPPTPPDNRNTFPESHRLHGDVHRRKREVSPCSLSSWYLDFRALGWMTWIQYPTGYHANYCSGSCSVTSSTTSHADDNMTSNHAFVRGLYRLVLRSEENAANEELPGSCCVPVRLSPINVLYRNEEQEWVIREVNEMVADRCGCL